MRLKTLNGFGQENQMTRDETKLLQNAARQDKAIAAAAPKKEWTVQDRYGWGWSAYDPATGCPAITPTCTRYAAQMYCESRNAGNNHEDAWHHAMRYGCTSRSCPGGTAH